MKTKTTILKAALICVMCAFISAAYGQTNIAAIGDFGNANMTSVNQVICMGKSVDLTVTGDAGTTYTWLTRHPSTDGTTAGTGTNLPANTGTLVDPATNLTAAGYYIYKLQATNTTTQCSEIFEQLVYVLPTPIVTLSTPTDLAACTNLSENITFTASNASGTGVTQTFAVNYQWYSQKQGESEAAIANTTNTYTLATGNAVGSYDYYVKVTYQIKNCGEATSDKKTVVITASPTKPTIGIASN